MQSQFAGIPLHIFRWGTAARLVSVFIGWVLVIGAARAEEVSSAIRELNDRPFFLGREYFALRSGRAQMMIQADQADLGPAVTFLIFDARNAAQSARKTQAFNYEPASGFVSSALRVELGKYPFTALGHRTETRWTLRAGIPAVQATWWAGGVRVIESISALGDEGTFERHVRLEGANLVGPEEVSIELMLPGSASLGEGGMLLHNDRDARLALLACGEIEAHVRPEQSTLRLGPVTVAPHEAVDISTFLLVQIPADEKAHLLQRAGGLKPTSKPSEQYKTSSRWATVSSIVTEDKTVQALFDHTRFVFPGLIADDGTMDAGVFEYGVQWVRDTSNTVLGAIHTGQFELAKAALERVLQKMVREDGATMIAGSFDEPDREQFDQMGELLHVLKAYRDWTGDDSLLRRHSEKLCGMVERPFQARFRSESGLVHNRREFWERTLEDGYELAYQTYVIQGLRDAADLAPVLGAPDRAERWRAESQRMLAVMLSDSPHGLIEAGRLIKRRNVNGEVADLQPGFPGFQPDTPALTEAHRRLMPDTSQALPIALHLIDPRSPIARRTLDELEGLLNTRWSDGGYDRYHTSSQPDQPGPWPFATCFILRAQHEAGDFVRSRRSLEWLNTVQGGRTGAWFEEIPSIRSTEATCGIVPWASAEVALFVVRHWLGVSFEGDTLLLRPALYPDSTPVSADLRFRGGRLRLKISGSGPVTRAVVNGTELRPDSEGRIRLPQGFSGGEVQLETASSR